MLDLGRAARGESQSPPEHRPRSHRLEHVPQVVVARLRAIRQNEGVWRGTCGPWDGGMSTLRRPSSYFQRGQDGRGSRTWGLFVFCNGHVHGLEQFLRCLEAFHGAVRVRVCKRAFV